MTASRNRRMSDFSNLRTTPRAFTVSVVAACVGASALTGCMLETRDDQDQKQVMQKQVQTLQKSTADVNQRFAEIDEDVRKANGRIEVDENSVRRLDQKVDRNAVALEARLRELQEKITAYRESIARLEQGMAEANAQIAALNEAMKRAAAVPRPVSSDHMSASDAFAAAEELFAKRDWKGAIPDYERYRKQSPTGAHWRDATYKIGLSFQELGMADDARAFYEELVSKAPGSAESKKARARLKAISGPAGK